MPTTDTTDHPTADLFDAILEALAQEDHDLADALTAGVPKPDVRGEDTPPVAGDYGDAPPG